MAAFSPVINKCSLCKDINHEEVDHFSEFTLEANVRTCYFDYIQKMLKRNYEASMVKNKNFTDLDFKDCATQMEKELLNTCVVVVYYRNALLQLISDIKQHTKKQKLYKRLSEYRAIHSTRETQTHDLTIPGPNEKRGENVTVYKDSSMNPTTKCYHLQTCKNKCTPVYQHDISTQTNGKLVVEACSSVEREICDSTTQQRNNNELLEHYEFETVNIKPEPDDSPCHNTHFNTPSPNNCCALEVSMCSIKSEKNICETNIVNSQLSNPISSNNSDAMSCGVISDENTVISPSSHFYQFQRKNFFGDFTSVQYNSDLSVSPEKSNNFESICEQSIYDSQLRNVLSQPSLDYSTLSPSAQNLLISPTCNFLQSHEQKSLSQYKDLNQKASNYENIYGHDEVETSLHSFINNILPPGSNTEDMLEITNKNKSFNNTLNNNDFQEESIMSSHEILPDAYQADNFEDINHDNNVNTDTSPLDGLSIEEKLMKMFSDDITDVNNELTENNENYVPVYDSAFEMKKWNMRRTHHERLLNKQLHKIRKKTALKARVHSKFIELFGTDESEITFTEKEMTMFKKRAAPWIVRYLMPYYRERRIASRDVFKYVASHVSYFILTRNWFPDEVQVKEKVDEFFERHGTILDKADAKFSS